ncbi:MAG TPA: hypothetical protein VGH51_05825 [Candidatus Angelobacter sp.]
MSNSPGRRTMIALLMCALLHVSAFATDAKETIKNARSSYYALKSQGLKTFQCEVTPDWRKFLENTDKKPLSATDPRLQKFGGLRFSVAIDQQGQSTITPFMANGDAIDPSLSQMIDGLKQMLSGFYQTWTALVFTNPFPESDSGTTLKQEGDNFRLLSKDGSSDVEILLNKDYAIIEMRVTSTGSKIIMLPKFERTAKGLLLTDIDSDINDGQQKVLLGITYQNVQGLNLPGHASFKITLPDQVVMIEATFSKYQITKQ